MFDAEFIAFMVRSRLADGVAPGSPQRIEVVASGFPDAAAAETFSDLMEGMGFATSQREGEPMPVHQWEEELREIGIAYDPACEEMGPFRTWRVSGTIAIDLSIAEFTKMQPLGAAAKEGGGFLCALSFVS
jgi:hypothetical protein